jgi:hypothetical protein
VDHREILVAIQNLLHQNLDPSLDLGQQVKIKDFPRHRWHEKVRVSWTVELQLLFELKTRVLDMELGPQY